MKNNAEFERLLDDVLFADDTACKGEAMLRRTLDQVRRRRMRRRLGRSVLVMAVLMTGLWQAWRFQWIAGHGRTPLPSFVQVVTMPLPPERIVKTQVGVTPLVVSTPGWVMLVETRNVSRRWQEIDDRQLFALLGGRSAILMRRGEGDEELIFFGPENSRPAWSP